MRATLAVARRALGNAALRRVMAAFLVFSVAEWATWVALLVWAYQERGVGGAATMSVVQLVPAVLVAPLGSVLGDRVRRGRALATGYVVQGLTMTGVAAALLADQPFAVLAAGGAVVSCAITLTRPVHHAVLPDISRNPEELTAGNAVSTTFEGVGAFLGPLSTGLLITRWGPESVFALYGVLLLVATAAVVTLPVPAEARGDTGESLAETLVGGVRELRREPAGAVLLAMVTSQFVVVGAMDILVIVLALDVIGTDSSGPGLLASVFGAGSVVGGLLTVVLVGRRSLGRALAVGMLLAGAPIVLLVGAGSLPVAAVLLGAWGVGYAFFDVAGRTQLQRTVSERALARVFGLQEALMTAALAAGAALAPLAVAGLGIRGALAVTGLLVPVTGLLASRLLRRLGATARPPGPLFAVLRAVPSFHVAPLTVVETLSRRTAELHVPPGGRVVTQGEPGDRFYVVVTGRVEVTRDGARVREMTAGESFGEIALLREVPRTATVTALEATTLAVLGRHDFLYSLGALPASRRSADEVAARYLELDRQPQRPPGP